MNPLTYLGFTIFSVFMQFCVMELINERWHLDEDPIISNITAQKSPNVIDKIKRNPHALFYRIENNKMIFKGKDMARLVKYSNSSLEDIDTSTSTDILSTTFEEVFYDENTSVTSDFFTTESYFTNTEFDNVTEITFFDKSSTTTAKPYHTKKIDVNKKCFCNLLYKKCDIYCCCDPDCSEDDRKLFINCGKERCLEFQKENINFCTNSSTCKDTMSTGIFDDLLCVAKVNLPDQRVKSHFKLDKASINNTFRWKSAVKPNVIDSNEKKKYEHGDPLRLLKNDTLIPLYLPTTVANNYCSGKKQIKFLINESVKCNIKVEDLYVFSALKAIEGTNLISITESSRNNTALNCSTFHCTTWNISVCNETCDDYNSTIHSPKCTEEYCSNIALKLEYTFYYFASRMTNASLKLYMNKISTRVPMLAQEVSVNWYLGNESIDNIIQLSGNPGYILGLPIITSSALNNHTSNFYNKTLKYSASRLTFPHNENGICVWGPNKNKTLLFGYNTRSKCRLILLQKNIINKNATAVCRNVQSYIKDALRLNLKLFLSPYGNPQDISDDKWIPLEVNDETFLYGEYQSKETKLKCFNLVSRYEFVVAFADMSEKINKGENKIIKATVTGTPYNITLEKAVLSIILTIDIRFIDISRPISEFAKLPHLHINLPKNFFFDYPSNKCFHLGSNIILVYLCSLIVLNNK